MALFVVGMGFTQYNQIVPGFLTFKIIVNHTGDNGRIVAGGLGVHISDKILSQHFQFGNSGFGPDDHIVVPYQVSQLPVGVHGRRVLFWDPTQRLRNIALCHTNRDRLLGLNPGNRI